ncbi:MAG: Spx/MgsR family RNA polymerase-binding regulatory protein [Xylophilus ampelinus]
MTSSPPSSAPAPAAGPRLYGIPNCDTVRKARRWLDAAGAPHAFHDFKKQGVPEDRLAAWAGALGWERLLNRQGTTWRTLDVAAQERAGDAAGALAAMAAHPSLIRRPVAEWPDGGITAGFDPDAWAARLASAGG